MIALALFGAGACVALGMGAANRLKQRETVLQAWDQALQRMDAAVNHSAAPLDEALRRGAAEEIPALLELRRRLKETPAASTEELLADLPWEESLSSIERDTLMDCLARLFSTSLQEQAQALAYARSQWTEYRKASRDAREKNSRLYTSLGWLGGAAVFILLC